MKNEPSASNENPSNTQSNEPNALNEPVKRKNVAEAVKAEIDHYCATAYNDGHRWHLGASLIGHECERYLWYIFRWCFSPNFSGRMQRLFNRGHREEERYIEWLKGIGFQVWTDDLDNNSLWYDEANDTYEIRPRSDTELCNFDEFQDVSHDETHIKRAKADGVKFPQYRMSGCGGHFGGSLDGVAKFPPALGIDEPVLLEFKTNCTGAGFTKLFTEGIEIHKPQHFVQTSTYGYKYNLNHVLYLNINKNDDDLYVELAALKHDVGQQAELKAERIIMSQKPPAKLSPNPSFFKCKYCDAKDLCHGDAFAEKNCRSCIHARPVDGAEWFCEVYNDQIPREIVPQACDSYSSITAISNDDV